MNRARIFAVAILFLLAATVVGPRATAQDDKTKDQQEEKSTQQDNVKPEKDKSKSPKDDKVKPDETKRDEAKPDDARQDERKPESAQNDEHARPAGKSAHIPDDKFRANFGREHTFTVTNVIHTTTIVAGQTQFVYGGYSFMFMDAWPVGWVMTDPCYIDYVDGGYFLLDPLHPGIQVSLFVSL